MNIHFEMRRRIILASSSPRRKELLSKFLGNNFEVIVPEVNEDEIIIDDPIERVKLLAFKKAESIANKVDSGIVIAADTIVVINNEILGKPKSVDEAFRMLKKLSGKKHKVITALALIDVDNNRKTVEVVETEVYMRKLSEKEIKMYIESGEPLGKAGSYAIQGLGAILIEKINGCFFNVVGLPLTKLYEILNNLDFNLLEEAVINYEKSSKGF